MVIARMMIAFGVGKPVFVVFGVIVVKCFFTLIRHSLDVEFYRILRSTGCERSEPIVSEVGE